MQELKSSHSIANLNYLHVSVNLVSSICWHPVEFAFEPILFNKTKALWTGILFIIFLFKDVENWRKIWKLFFLLATVITGAEQKIYFPFISPAQQEHNGLQLWCKSWAIKVNLQLKIY